MERTEIRIANQLAEIERVSRWAEHFAATHALPLPAQMALLVSFDEVLNNVISYGYLDEGAHEILVRLEIQDGVVTAEVEDDGAAFDPLAVPPPILEGAIRERPVGGIGIHFVKTLNDEVNYERVENKNRLTFKKRVPGTV